MTDKTCATCRHQRSAEDFGTCGNHVSVSPDGVACAPPPDFGCTLHEPKPPLTRKEAERVLKLVGLELDEAVSKWIFDEGPMCSWSFSRLPPAERRQLFWRLASIGIFDRMVDIVCCGRVDIVCCGRVGPECGRHERAYTLATAEQADICRAALLARFEQMGVLP